MSYPQRRKAIPRGWEGDKGTSFAPPRDEGQGERGKVVCSPLGVGLIGAGIMFRGSILSPAITLGNGGGLHDVASPAFSVASHILGLGADNQNATTGRITP